MRIDSFLDDRPMVTSHRFLSTKQDLRFALRTFVRNIGFTTTVVATFALGIGVTTAMLTVVNAVLIQPLPYPTPDRIVFLRSAMNGVSVPDFVDYRESEGARRVFQSLATWDGSSVIVTGNGDPEQLRALNVTPSFFGVLGLPPVRGRFFNDQDERFVAVISGALWKRRFGADESIIGKTITLDGNPVTVVGISPALVDPTLNADLFRPFDFYAPHATVRAYHNQPMLGRLRPGVTPQAAQSAMSVISARLATAYPEDAHLHVQVDPYANVVVGDAKAQLLALLAAVLLVFGIACANIASLMVARSTTRHGELSTRVALGASGARLVQQLITESVVLSVAGGSLGMALAVGLILQLKVTAPLPRMAELHVGGLTWLSAIILSVLAGVLVGTVSAVRAARAALQGSLGVGARGTGSRRASRLRDTAVVLQLTASMLLLTGAGALLQSFWRLSHVNPGFDPDDVLTATIAVPRSRYDPASGEQLWTRFLNDVKGLPQVVDVTAASQLPMATGGNASYAVVGRPAALAVNLPSALIDVIADDYFRTMRIPLISGKSFEASGLTNDEVSVVISASLAKSLFLFEPALGKRLAFPDFGGFTAVIVGVAGDVRASGLNFQPPDVIYLPLHQLRGWSDWLHLVVRTRGDPLAVSNRIRDALGRRDPLLTLSGVKTMADIVGRSSARSRIETLILTAFAVCAIALAALGLYGLLAYSVATRHSEFAIRYALGIQARQLFSLVVRRGMTLVGAGLAIGLVLLPTIFGVLRHVFDIVKVDASVLVATTAVLSLIGFVACVGPALHAVRLGSRWVRNT